jgi:galactitol-specific phosphotransferase system IIB component
LFDNIDKIVGVSAERDILVKYINEILNTMSQAKILITSRQIRGLVSDKYGQGYIIPVPPLSDDFSAKLFDRIAGSDLEK